jgi:hypothetical protein
MGPVTPPRPASDPALGPRILFFSGRGPLDTDGGSRNRTGSTAEVLGM